MAASTVNERRRRAILAADPEEHRAEHVCLDGRRYVASCPVTDRHAPESKKDHEGP